MKLYYMSKYFILLCNIYNQKLIFYVSNSYGIVYVETADYFEQVISEKKEKIYK